MIDGRNQTTPERTRAPWQGPAAALRLEALAPPEPASGAAPSLGAALRGLRRAARLEKNVPLAFLVLAGGLTAPPPLSPSRLAACLVLLMVSAAFMTHLNIITDMELDRERKPQLWHWLSTDPRLMLGAMGLELGVVLGGVGVLAMLAPVAAAGLATFTLLTVLYSYNFLVPRNAVAWRLKAHWLGHFGVCMGAYLSLWVAGHFSSEASSAESLALWLPSFVCASLSEYSLFLSESALDAREEQRLGLRTFARLLGRHGSSVLALLVWLVAAGGLVAHAAAGLDAAMRRQVLIAFGPALLARGLTNLLLALRLAGDDGLRARLPDVTFWAGRLATTAALAWLLL